MNVFIGLFEVYELSLGCGVEEIGFSKIDE